MTDLGFQPIDPKRAAAAAREVLARMKKPAPPRLDELAAMPTDADRDKALAKTSLVAAEKKTIKADAAKIRGDWQKLLRLYWAALGDLDFGLAETVELPDGQTGLPVRLSRSDRREIVLMIERYKKALGIASEKPAQRQPWA